jgi:hypothetical protein
LTLVADTNVLIELFLPTTNADSVQHWRAVDKDWRLPSLWICEFRHIPSMLIAPRPFNWPIAMAVPVTSLNSWFWPNNLPARY